MTTSAETSVAAKAPEASGGLHEPVICTAPVQHPVQHPMAFVFLNKDIAFYCQDHDTSEKRTKAAPALRCCTGCHMSLQTNYSTLAFCPRCSSQKSLCMICGSEESRYGPDGMLKQVSMSVDTSAPASSEGSRPRSLNGDLSSDAESTCGASAGASAACEVAVPPVQQLASDWLGDAIVDNTQPVVCSSVSGCTTLLGDAIDDGTQPTVCSSMSGCTTFTNDEVQPASAETNSLFVLEDGLCDASLAASPAAPTVFEELGVVLAAAEVASAEKTSSRQAADDHDPFAVCRDTCGGISRKVTGHVSDEQLLQDVYIAGSAGTPEMEGNIGDRLRQAVMDGRTNAVMGLFNECNSSKKQVTRCERVASAAAADRFAALNELQSTQAPTLASNGYTSEPVRDIVLPQQLSELSSQHLLRMNAMVSHAMQQHNEVPAASSSVPESQTSQQFGDVLMAFHEKNPSWDDKPKQQAPTKRRDPTTKEFGDLIASFNEKNAISGFKSS